MTTTDTPIFTTSERRTLKRCEWRWWQAYREGLAPTRLSPALWFGIGTHEALATLYGKGRRRRAKSAIQRWHDFCDDDELSMPIRDSDDEWQNARDLGEGMLLRYMDHYQLDRDWDVIFTEHPFRIAIPIVVVDEVEGGDEYECVFCSTFDGVYRDPYGRILLMEHKTAKAINLNHLEGDEQGSVYFAVASRILQERGILAKGEHIEGITYNFLRKALPDDRPRNEAGLALNKDGSISKSQPPPFFVRQRVDRRKSEVVRIIEQISVDAYRANLLRSNPDLLTKNHTQDCYWDCPYYQMCLLHDAGVRDWVEVRDATFIVRDPYRIDYRKAA